MPLPRELDSIARAQKLHDWFGYWPDFHDAEVIRFHLNRDEASSLLIHTWEITKQIDSRGYYEMAKHVVVEFVLGDLLNLTLDGFTGQNVISSLGLEKIETGYRVTLAPCYGLSGSIEAQTVSIHLTPGQAPNQALSS